MASTVTAATMTVTITEALTHTDSEGTGRDVARTNTFDIASIAMAVSNLVEITTTETGLMAFAADVATPPAATVAATYAVGHFDQAAVRYIRITNKDDTNFVTLRFRGTDGAEFATIIDKGQSYLYGCKDDGGTVLTMDADTAATTIVLQDLEDITADADTGTCMLDVFVATV